MSNEFVFSADITTLPWNDASELFIGTRGGISVAPEGTALPTLVDEALDEAFIGVGLITDDGVTFHADPEVSDHRAHQSRYAIRRSREAEDYYLTFALEQWNEINVPLAFGGGEIEDFDGMVRYEPPDPEEVDERALVCDLQDGSTRFRIVFPRGTVTDAITSDANRASLALLPITFRALPEDDLPVYLLTNSEAFAINFQ